MTAAEGFWALVEAGWPDPCPIHATLCPDEAGCVAAAQAECVARGLPEFATGGEA